MMFTSRILQAMEKSNLELTPDPSRADYLIVNSCTFDEYHENRSISKIKEFIMMKGKVVLIGCLASISPDYLSDYDIEIIPQINDLPDAIPELTEFDKTSPIINTQLKESFSSDLNADKYLDSLKEYNTGPLLWLYNLTAGILSKNPANKRLIDSMADDINIEYDYSIADVEISRGCIFKCAYCIIRKARGSLVSRPIDDIIADIGTLHGDYPVIRLVSDECGSYGLDIGSNFFELMKEIHRNFPGIRINIFYLHPYYIENNFDKFKWIVDNININSINISVQSFSQNVLDQMNRPYSVRIVVKAINYIRNRNPKTIIRTHVIIGYPSESPLDYIRTMINLNRVDILAAFEYSPRIGTTAYKKYGDSKLIMSSIRFKKVLLMNRMLKGLKMIGNIIFANK